MMEEQKWPVKPMEPVAREDAFDSADTLFQVKWDGVRVLTYVYPDKRLRFFNRRLNERTAQYPELAEALCGLPKSTVLDGEVVALSADGKPDFPRVLKRDLLRSQFKIKMGLSQVPVNYMVFDLLWLDGEAVHAYPLSRRLELLGEVSFKTGPVHLVESAVGAGRALFQAVKAENLEGIVAKKLGSPYRIGRKTDAWQKIKCLRHLTAAVGGYIKTEGRIKSLLLGIPDEAGLLFIGAAASGVTQKQWQALGRLFAQSQSACPFSNTPVLDGACWTEPLLHAHVRFLEYTNGGVMRAPAITGFSEAL